MKASSSLAKRAAAVAASGWTKLLVRKSASEFSPQALGGKPSRTASVSRRVPFGKATRGIFRSVIGEPLRPDCADAPRPEAHSQPAGDAQPGPRAGGQRSSGGASGGFRSALQRKTRPVVDRFI